MIWDQKALEKFVTIWQSKTVAEVAKEFGISKSYATVKATELRTKGVELRSHKTQNADYEALKLVAKGLAKKKQ